MDMLLDMIERGYFLGVKQWGEDLGLKFIGCGKDRVTFANPYTNSVIKVPWHRWALAANEREAAWSAKDARYARCSLEMFEGVPILHMEKVNTRVRYDNLERWCDFIDCSQVGYTVDGRLVAYDYADSSL